MNREDLRVTKPVLCDSAYVRSRDDRIPGEQAGGLPRAGGGWGGDGAFSLTRRLQTVGRAGPGGTNARVLRATGQCAKAVKTVQRTWTDVSPDDRQAHEKMLSIAVIRKQAGRIAPSRTAATPTRGVGRPRAGPEAEQLLQEAAWQVLSGSTVEPPRGPAVPRLAHTQGTCTCVHGALQGCRQQREEETTTVPRAAHPHGRAWRRAARRRLRSAADAGLRTVSRRQRASALSQNKGKAQAARARPAGRGLNAPGQSSAQGPLRPCSLASVGVLAQTDVKILQRRSLSRAPPGGRGVGAEARVAACSPGWSPRGVRAGRGVSPQVRTRCGRPSVTTGHESGALSTQRHGRASKAAAGREQPDPSATDAVLGVEAPPKCGARECGLLGSGAFADVISEDRPLRRARPRAGVLVRGEKTLAGGTVV